MSTGRPHAMRLAGNSFRQSMRVADTLRTVRIVGCSAARNRFGGVLHGLVTAGGRGRAVVVEPEARHLVRRELLGARQVDNDVGVAGAVHTRMDQPLRLRDVGRDDLGAVRDARKRLAEAHERLELAHGDAVDAGAAWRGIARAQRFERLDEASPRLRTRPAPGVAAAATARAGRRCVRAAAGRGVGGQLFCERACASERRAPSPEGVSRHALPPSRPCRTTALSVGLRERA